MNRVSPVLISLLFVLAGCTTSQKRAELPEGVDLLFAGKAQEAHDVFQELCEQGAELDCALSGAIWSSPQGLPVLQGFSNTEWARVNVFPADDSKVRYYYRPVGPFALKSLKPKSHRVRKNSRLRVDRLNIAVQPGVTYELLALSETGELLDRRKFSGLKLTADGKKFALLSCMDDSFKDEQKIMWHRVQEQHPDVLLMIGRDACIYIPA